MTDKTTDGALYWQSDPELGQHARIQAKLVRHEQTTSSDYR